LIQTPKKILIVEDEASVAGFIKTGLEDEGYSVTLANNGNAGWKELQANIFDLILLDIRMPGMDGLTLCKKIREEQKSQTPVIMLTALNETSDVIYGLDIGADDYVTKPFSPRELVLRVKALLKRASRVGEADGSDQETLTFGEILVDQARHRVRVGDEEPQLTALEFRLLSTFIKRRGRVQSRERLLDDVWGIDVEVTTRTVDTHVKRLREKLGSAGRYIETVRGVGYRFSETPEAAPLA
jgi:two-component system phosphate regulon response regulator PhoB